MINNRYILGERLFESGKLGELFRARDTLAIQNGSCPQVLIHFISSVEMSYAEYRRIGDQLQQWQEASKSNPVILKVMDSGWTGDKGYFVLESPEAWSVSILPPISTSPTSLHQRADRLVRGLQKQQLLHVALDPSFFLVDSNGDLYLLGTALNSFVQKLQPSAGLLSGVTSKCSAKTNTGVFKWVGWSLLVVGSASLAGGVYVNREAISARFPLLSPDSLTSSSVIVDKETDQLQTELLLSQEKPEMMSTLADQQATPVVPIQAEPIEVQTEKVAVQLEVGEVGSLNIPVVASAESVEVVEAEEAASGEETMYFTASVHKPLTPSEQKVLQRAEQSLKGGQVQSAVYHLSRLWRAGVKDGELLAMVNAMAADQQRLAKMALASGALSDATAAVNQADRIIKQFELDDFVEVQRQLERDLAVK